MNPLNHVAIIMDGNGRWGLKYRNSRNAGHKEGLKTVETIIKSTIKNRIKFLTLYAFSTENWQRPKKEINYLFKLLENFLTKRLEDIHKQDIRIKILHIGLNNFPKKNRGFAIFSATSFGLLFANIFGKTSPNKSKIIVMIKICKNGSCKTLIPE